MTIQEKLTKVRNLERYQDFHILDKPISCKDFCAGKKYDIIQLHSIEPLEEPDYIIGFCGVCSWKDDVLRPEDGDIYVDSMLIYGYSEFTSSDGEIGLDILVYEW